MTALFLYTQEMRFPTLLSLFFLVYSLWVIPKVYNLSIRLIRFVGLDKEVNWL